MGNAFVTCFALTSIQMRLILRPELMFFFCSNISPRRGPVFLFVYNAICFSGEIRSWNFCSKDLQAPLPPPPPPTHTLLKISLSRYYQYPVRIHLLYLYRLFVRLVYISKNKHHIHIILCY